MSCLRKSACTGTSWLHPALWLLRSGRNILRNLARLRSLSLSRTLFAGTLGSGATGELCSQSSQSDSLSEVYSTKRGRCGKLSTVAPPGIASDHVATSIVFCFDLSSVVFLATAAVSAAYVRCLPFFMRGDSLFETRTAFSQLDVDVFVSP